MRRLLGWEPGEVTTYEYDTDGRLERAITVREPEFSDWDRSVMLHDKYMEGLPRGSHGILVSEAIDPANQNAFRAEDPVMDFAAKTISDAQSRYKKAWPDADMSVLRWRVSRA